MDGGPCRLSAHRRGAFKTHAGRQTYMRGAFKTHAERQACNAVHIRRMRGAVPLRLAVISFQHCREERFDCPEVRQRVGCHQLLDICRRPLETWIWTVMHSCIVDEQIHPSLYVYVCACACVRALGVCRCAASKRECFWTVPLQCSAVQCSAVQCSAVCGTHSRIESNHAISGCDQANCAQSVRTCVRACAFLYVAHRIRQARPLQQLLPQVAR